MKTILEYITAAPATAQFGTDKVQWLFKYPQNRKRVVCKDGATMSVQASAFHYSFPRDNGGNYLTVEVGFPSHPFTLAEEYRDGDCDVFAYVPVQLVVDWVESHGGFDYEKTMSL
jgi:hypothetical protein